MGSVGALGVGLSVVFAGFVLVLLAELYYIFFWKSQSVATSKRVDSVGVENEQRGSYAHEAAFVGSFGGYPASPLQQGFVTKFIGIAGKQELLDQATLPQNGKVPPCGLLFPIKEETKEDMEFEEHKSKNIPGNRARNRTPSGVLFAPFSSGSITPEETPFATPASSPSACSPLPFSPTSTKRSPFTSPLRVLKERPPTSSSSDTVLSTNMSTGMPASHFQSSPRATPFSTPPMRPLRCPLKVLFDLSPILGAQEATRIESPAPQPSSSNVREPRRGTFGCFSVALATSSPVAIRIISNQPSTQCPP